MTRFVWDWQTRLCHWLIAGLFVFSWWTADNRMMDWHRLSGVALAGVLVFRFYWGFAGPETARFASFIKGPRSVIRYARSLFSREHRITHGHNPVGALSVVAMLLALVLQVGLGLIAVDTDGMESGPLARHVSFDMGRDAAKAHALVFDILVVLVWLHIAAIAFYLIVKRANLLGPMFTGRRSSPPPDGVSPEMQAAPLWRMLPGLGLAALIVWFLAG